VFVARAPGKLVALGEYAVLDGAPAIVLAVDRYAEVAVGRATDGVCALTMYAPDAVERRFAPGNASGAELLDVVTAGVEPPLAWVATVDSRAFFAGLEKLGLGSSAAVLCAWAGGFRALARSEGRSAPELNVAELIDLHRRFQGGRGSGLDVAASCMGGAISFRLTGSGLPQYCRIRGYFCRPLCLYTRVRCALPGVATRSAAGGGEVGGSFDGARRSRIASSTGGRLSRVAYGIRGLRPRLAGARCCHRRGHRDGRAS
jgi:hypothetical protein